MAYEEQTNNRSSFFQSAARGVGLAAFGIGAYKTIRPAVEDLADDGLLNILNKRWKQESTWEPSASKNVLDPLSKYDFSKMQRDIDSLVYSGQSESIINYTNEILKRYNLPEVNLWDDSSTLVNYAKNDIRVASAFNNILSNRDLSIFAGLPSDIPDDFGLLESISKEMGSGPDSILTQADWDKFISGQAERINPISLTSEIGNITVNERDHLVNQLVKSGMGEGDATAFIKNLEDMSKAYIKEGATDRFGIAFASRSDGNAMRVTDMLFAVDPLPSIGQAINPINRKDPSSWIRIPVVSQTGEIWRGNKKTYIPRFLLQGFEGPSSSPNVMISEMMKRGAKYIGRDIKSLMGHDIDPMISAVARSFHDLNDARLVNTPFSVEHMLKYMLNKASDAGYEGRDITSDTLAGMTRANAEILDRELLGWDQKKYEQEYKAYAERKAAAGELSDILQQNPSQIQKGIIQRGPAGYNLNDINITIGTNKLQHHRDRLLYMGHTGGSGNMYKDIVRSKAEVELADKLPLQSSGKMFMTNLHANKPFLSEVARDLGMETPSAFMEQVMDLSGTNILAGETFSLKMARQNKNVVNMILFGDTGRSGFGEYLYNFHNLKVTNREILSGLREGGRFQPYMNDYLNFLNSLHEINKSGSNLVESYGSDAFALAGEDFRRVSVNEFTKNERHIIRSIIANDEGGWTVKGIRQGIADAGTAVTPGGMKLSWGTVSGVPSKRTGRQFAARASSRLTFLRDLERKFPGQKFKTFAEAEEFLASSGFDLRTQLSFKRKMPKDRGEILGQLVDDLVFGKVSKKTMTKLQSNKAFSDFTSDIRPYRYRPDYHYFRTRNINFVSVETLAEALDNPTARGVADLTASSVTSTIAHRDYLASVGGSEATNHIKLIDEALARSGYISSGKGVYMFDAAVGSQGLGVGYDKLNQAIYSQMENVLSQTGGVMIEGGEGVANLPYQIVSTSALTGAGNPNAAVKANLRYGLKTRGMEEALKLIDATADPSQVQEANELMRVALGIERGEIGNGINAITIENLINQGLAPKSGELNPLGQGILYPGGDPSYATRYDFLKDMIRPKDAELPYGIDISIFNLKHPKTGKPIRYIPVPNTVQPGLVDHYTGAYDKEISGGIMGGSRYAFSSVDKSIQTFINRANGILSNYAPGNIPQADLDDLQRMVMTIGGVAEEGFKEHTIRSASVTKMMSRSSIRHPIDAATEYWDSLVKEVASGSATAEEIMARPGTYQKLMKDFGILHGTTVTAEEQEGIKALQTVAQTRGWAPEKLSEEIERFKSGETIFGVIEREPAPTMGRTSPAGIINRGHWNSPRDHSGYLGKLGEQYIKKGYSEKEVRNMLEGQGRGVSYVPSTFYGRMGADLDADTLAKLIVGSDLEDPAVKELLGSAGVSKELLAGGSRSEIMQEFNKKLLTYHLAYSSTHKTAARKARAVASAVSPGDIAAKQLLEKGKAGVVFNWIDPIIKFAESQEMPDESAVNTAMDFYEGVLTSKHGESPEKLLDQFNTFQEKWLRRKAIGEAQRDELVKDLMNLHRSAFPEGVLAPAVETRVQKGIPTFADMMIKTGFESMSGLGGLEKEIIKTKRGGQAGQIFDIIDKMSGDMGVVPEEIAFNLNKFRGTQSSSYYRAGKGVTKEAISRTMQALSRHKTPFMVGAGVAGAVGFLAMKPQRMDLTQEEQMAARQHAADISGNDPAVLNDPNISQARFYTSVDSMSSRYRVRAKSAYPQDYQMISSNVSGRLGVDTHISVRDQRDHIKNIYDKVREGRF